MIAAKYSDPGKITGMLLELENEEILKIFEDPKYLTERATEATRVWNEYLVSCAICENLFKKNYSICHTNFFL